MTDRRRAFSFRQRVGKLNWKKISGINLEAVVDELDLDELQVVLDNVTFSEVRPTDIRSSSVESTTKLICVMQLMLEHLLYCQESQYQLIKQLYQKIGSQSKEISELNKKNAAYKESIKIYQRQIAMLQKNQTQPTNDHIKAIPPAPKTQPATALPPAVDYVQPVLESVLNHERKTREYLRDILHEQRDQYLQELQRISPRDNSNDIITLKYDINDRFSEMLEKIQSMQLLHPPVDTSRQDHLLRLEEELKHREQQLREREQRLVYREEGMERRMKEAVVKAPRQSVSVQTPREENQPICDESYKDRYTEVLSQLEALRERENQLKDMISMESGYADRYAEAIAQLEAAKQRENDWRRKYENERENYMVEKARYNTLVKQKASAAAIRYVDTHLGLCMLMCLVPLLGVMLLLILKDHLPHSLLRLSLRVCSAQKIYLPKPCNAFRMMCFLL